MSYDLEGEGEYEDRAQTVTTAERGGSLYPLAGANLRAFEWGPFPWARDVFQYLGNWLMLQNYGPLVGKRRRG